VPTTADAAGEDAPANVHDADELGAGPVEVAILGPLEIHGGADPRPRQQSVEMLVYLALHRQPVTLQGLSGALWPDRPFLHRTVRNRLSDLRPYIHRQLAKLPGGRYRLTDLVVTDWQRFRALSEGNPNQQLAALALVRGIPFTGVNLDWYHLDGLLGEIEASIVDLALHVADRALKQRDYERARTAALAGLRGCPYDERLYRAAMQSAAARGATGELHQLRRQLAYVLDDELEPDDTIQPATEQLYRALRDQPAPPRRG
jgi:DNA-binding SARP family transcriptional activator